jgi:hypothetical protein
MTTSFSYGRGGRLYRYYVAGSLDPARFAESGRPLRVPASPLEKLVLGSLARLTGSSPAGIDPRALLLRVELWKRSIQLVLDRAKLLDPHESAAAALKNLEHRLQDERLEAEDDGDLRIIIDRPAIFRGGAASCVRGRDELKPNEQLRSRLRSAYGLLERHCLAPTAPEAHRHATAPTDQRQRHTVALGLVAPSIQKRILAGDPVDMAGQQFGSLPLAWADQLDLFS